MLSLRVQNFVFIQPLNINYKESDFSKIMS